MQLDTPLEQIKGVGPKSAEQFASAGLETVEDLIYFLPYRYDDYSNTVSIADIKPGKVTLKGKFSGVSTKRVRRGLHVTEATLRDQTDAVSVTWFNQPYRAEQIGKGGEWLVTGEFKLSGQRYQLLNPAVESAGGEALKAGQIVPVYHAIKGLKSQLVFKIINELKPVITMLDETLPDDLVQREGLISHAQAMLKLHFPVSSQDVEQAKARLGFEEVLSLMLASELNKQANSRLKSFKIPFDAKLARRFVASLPFKLTDDQRLSAWEIVQNLESDQPMNRLLQGDVGAGKTVVAGLAAYLAADQGYQTALLAPTEILAAQHADTLAKLLQPFNISVALLTGSVKGQARTKLYQSIETGSSAVVVGTHALLTDKFNFHKLGLVVIDEQHRFGVKQRQALFDKSQKMPHVLSMTATPIPRSLQLTVYGELDISLIKQKPAGRLPIKTVIISPNSRAQLYEKIDKQITGGAQVYVVCPLIDESREGEQKSVEAEFKRLKNSIFKNRRIGLLHGRLKADDKAAVMQEFLDGRIDILVTTTVVEVGVDVPNAIVMIIEGADRFGLAQLHQLRGRVGRSDKQSYCYLIPSTSAKPSQRLREMEKSNDGFYLAEKDLELRGPGEIYGRAQHGQLRLAVANLADTALLKKAQAAARSLIAKDFDLLQYKRLSREVDRYQRLTTLN
ncbi:MAG TPA: ATP-dependent DNA helicase RecG [Candidatus Saccharimonadales bacterium]|nr:ATP-dependent DNA helicase RecG [Candidatus Saccharimonadales bacterium]